MQVKAKLDKAKLKFYPDKPNQLGPDRLDEWQESGDYTAEQKVDGWRIILQRAKDGFVALTRHNNSGYSFEFCDVFRNDLEKLLDLVPVGTQIDGEWFGRRLVDLRLPPKYYAFDVLRWGKDWQINTTLRSRLEFLDGLFENFQGKSIERVKSAPKGLSWSAFYQQQIDMGIDSLTEGLVVKHLDSTMEADRRECKKSGFLYKIKFRSGNGGDINIEKRRR
jgi:ATP-dependent DNA ligase